MSLMETNRAESATEAMRAEWEERMAAALQERGAGSMVQLEVTRAFWSDINGAVGDIKVLPVPVYRRLLATVQPWAPDGPPEFWRVLNEAAPAVGALNTDPAGDQLTTGSATVLDPAVPGAELGDLPGAPPPDEPIGPPASSLPDPVVTPDEPIGPPAGQELAAAATKPAKPGKSGSK